MTTESSVVVALREVRRLELERQRREEEARKRAQREQEEERSRTENAQRASIQYGPGLAPYVNNGQSWSVTTEGQADAYPASVRRTAEMVPLAQQVYAESQSVPAPPPGWLEEGVAFRPPPKAKSRFGAVLLTILFCGGGAAAGYWKLSGEWKATLSRVEAERQQAEEQRNEAVAARSRAEQEMRVKMAEMQARLTAATTKSVAAETALAAKELEASGGPGAGAAPPLLGNRNRLGGPRRNRGPAFRGMAAPRPINPTVKLNGPGIDGKPSPKVAKKKNLSDDPLQGLRL
jgi:hypothetical protein